MPSSFADVGRIRLDNALALFDEFVRATVKHPDAATLRGLDRRFAERVLIQPSYWSQLKSRSRQIGERLARQFEQCCHKPSGWMDRSHAAGESEAAARAIEESSGPRDEDERFIVGLVLTYYRRHPDRARTQLLGLLGEVLSPPPTLEPPAGVATPAVRAGSLPRDDRGHSDELWRKSSEGIAPLRRKR